MERLKEELDSQQATIVELHYQLDHQKEHESATVSRLQASTAEVERLQQEMLSLVKDKKTMLGENSELRAKCDHQKKQVTELTDQIER